MSRMCKDPGIYELDEYWRSMGLADEDQVRHEVLWRAARQGDAPIHTGSCRYCADLLASFKRLQSVLESEAAVTVAVCPGAADFAAYYYGSDDAAIAAHLKVCSACREDLAFMARSQEPRERVLPLKRRLVWLGAAAAALIFSLLPWPWNKKAGPFPPHAYQQSSQYASLAEAPPIDRKELMAMSPADHHSRLDQVLAAYDKGDYKQAERVADIIYRAVEDPSAAYLLGVAQYKEGKLPQALESMRASERMDPPSAYRCWGTLQLALMVGDRATIDRELHHVENDSPYRDRCNLIRSHLKG